MTAASLAHALEARKVGSSWMARCPGHQDKTPSLAIREKSGKIMVYCHAGCSQATVIRALCDRGLWESKEFTPAERRDYRRVRHQAESLARDAGHWRSAMVDELKLRQLAALAVGDWARWERVSADLYAIRFASGADLLKRYLAARSTDAAETARIVAIGREDEAEAVAITAVVVAILAQAQEVRCAA